jgi:hypothetical protein
MLRRKFAVFCASSIVVVSLLVACKKTAEAPGSQNATAVSEPKSEPPPLPETSFGKLTGVSRSETTETQILCNNPSGLAFVTSNPNLKVSMGPSARLKANRGAEVQTVDLATMCSSAERQTADQANTFLILEFQGKKEPAANSELVTWASATNSQYLTRIHGRSFLTDADGKKIKSPIFFEHKDSRRLAFQVPKSATGLVWHDGKTIYRTEPTIAEVQSPAEPSIGKPATSSGKE